MLDGLFVTPAVTAIAEALGELGGGADARAQVAVVGHARLATALGDRYDVLPIAISARAARRLPRALPDPSSLPATSLAAVVGVEASRAEAWPALLRAWIRVVRDGGVIALVDRGPALAEEASRRALCAGLCEIEQRIVGRIVITSGLVTHLVPPAPPTPPAPG
jgi:hypothetical protein